MIMHISRRTTSTIARFIISRVAGKRRPDFAVGADSENGPYLLRWYLTPWRRLQGRLRSRAERQPSRTRRALAYLVGMLPNVYLHCFLRDDDDRALHDHPSWAVSYILRGGYCEHTIAEGGIHYRRSYTAGTLRFMGTRHTHRIELFDLLYLKSRRGGLHWMKEHGRLPTKRQCWTLFLFGPTVRDWGFHCPERGWVHWREFTAAGKPGEVGRGCD